MLNNELEKLIRKLQTIQLVTARTCSMCIIQGNKKKKAKRAAQRVVAASPLFVVTLFLQIHLSQLIVIVLA